MASTQAMQSQIGVQIPPSASPTTPSPLAMTTTPPVTTQTPNTPPPIFSPIELMVFGGISGCVAKTMIAPADNIKILYQINPNQKFSLIKAAGTAQQIAQNHGVRALWRGNSATLFRVFPYASINYTAHELYFHQLQIHTSSQTTLSPIQYEGVCRFIAGGLAGTTSTLVTYPLDVFRARLAASIHAQHPGCNTYMGTIRNVYQTLGIRGIFSGLLPTLLGIFPYNGFSFATFHTLKKLYLNHYNFTSASTTADGQETVVHLNKLPVLVHLTCGAVAALIGQSLTYPLDVVRRRKQVGTMAAMSVTACFKHIYQHEGMYGFFRGLTMNWVKGPIATAVSFVVNDRMKHVAEDRKASNGGKYLV